MKKILIVDDSLIYRHALNSALTEGQAIQVVGSVKNGQEALDFILKNPLDLITLDLEMPIMNGFQLIEKLASLPSRPRIIVFASADETGAENTMRALRLGADDFVTKIEGKGDVNDSIKDIKDSLIPKIYSLLKITGFEVPSRTPPPKATPTEVVPLRSSGLAHGHNTLKKTGKDYDFIFIGTSTGGPEALRFLFKNFTGNRMPPIFIVQHMPAKYTSYLAETLKESTSYKVVEAKQGDVIKSGMCYVAPGDYHMTVDGNKISLNQEPQECFVRPSVNYLFRSGKALKNKSLFVVLTGMGNDGLEGIQELTDETASLNVLIQDEASSVVWGMPGEIYQRRLHSEIQSLINIKDILLRII